MTEADLPLQGIAYVPGVARGILRRGGREPGRIDLRGPGGIMDNGDRPAALVVVDGAPLSHRTIGLVARGIPTVLISAAQATRLRDGRNVVVDGTSGWISDDPADPAARRTAASRWSMSFSPCAVSGRSGRRPRHAAQARVS